MVKSNISNNLYFTTMCKKNHKEYYKENECYICFIIDHTACCVLYDNEFNNLAFSNSEFIENFYTELEMRKLKLQKINATNEK